MDIFSAVFQERQELANGLGAKAGGMLPTRFVPDNMTPVSSRDGRFANSPSETRPLG